MSGRVALCIFVATASACATEEGSARDAGAGADAGLEAWQAELLAAHNRARASALPTPNPALEALTWSPAVSATAQAWADACTFEHNTSIAYGENLYGSTVADSPTAVIGSWQNESSSYTYDTNSCAEGKSCGHYTQVVWRATKELGCGKAKCTTGSPFTGSSTWYLWVCDYAPPGNFSGQKPY